MRLKHKKYLSFTLIELLTVTVILWLIMPCIIAIYSFMVKSNKEFALRQTAIQQWYEFFERLNILMQDYTIDYEEYFNRQMVWCSYSWGILLTWNSFQWVVWTSWYCTEFTAYWNENSTKRNIGYWGEISTWYHDIYNCTDHHIEWQNIAWLHRTIWKANCWSFWTKQSFGQYKALFTDVWKAEDSDDDKDLWKPLNDDVKAIVDDKNIQELYLISHDWKRRLYFRRKLVNQAWDFAQYKIQILRLRWFDAGQKHDFDSLSEWSYDMQIDTRACDTSMWFIWHWSGVSSDWAYSWYKLPLDSEDCRVDLSYWNTNIFTRNISISPTSDPNLYRADEKYQINPYVKMLVVNNIYLPTSFSGNSINEFKVPIETTINTKNFYK